MIRLITLLITIILSSSMLIEPGAQELPASQSYAYDGATVRIGLYYGNSALAYANLQNETGSGYQFGYFDNGRTFVPLGNTDIVKITMIKNRNLYINSASEYVDEQPSNETGNVGCYHIRLGQYSSFDEAANAAATLDGAYPAYDSGNFYVQYGSYFTASEASDANSSLGLGGTVLTGSDRCVVVVASGTSDIIFWFDYGATHSLGVMPVSESEQKPVTWFKGYKYYGGFEYTRNSGPDITVVNVVNIDDYIKGVLPYEMSSSWPAEALKAQAVCARTYVAFNMNKHRTYGFDVCTGTDCQVYMGLNQAGASTDNAVDTTVGQYITYDGKIASVFYHSSDGGATEDSENIFSEELPWLRGINDTYEHLVKTGRETWATKFTSSEITTILQGKGYPVSNIVSVTPTYTKMGNMYSMKFTDSNGRNFTFEREAARSILNSQSLSKSVYSQRFSITVDGAANAVPASTANPDSGAMYILGQNDPYASPDVYVVGADGTPEKINTDGLVVLSPSGTEVVSAGGSDVPVSTRAPLVSGEVQSGSSYLVKGSGWGHNVGMSQYGAKAMAETGLTYSDILTYYFTGISIGDYRQ